jgi:hypothetical protein
VSITANGGFRTPDGIEHGFLPVDRPPESPPCTFHWDGVTYAVDPEECANFYRSRGIPLPEKVMLYLPEPHGAEEHDWVSYGHRFHEHRESVVNGTPLPARTPPASEA